MIIYAFLVGESSSIRRLPCWHFSSWEVWIARVGNDVFRINRCETCDATWEYDQTPTGEYRRWGR